MIRQTVILVFLFFTSQLKAQECQQWEFLGNDRIAQLKIKKVEYWMNHSGGTKKELQTVIQFSENGCMKSSLQRNTNGNGPAYRFTTFDYDVANKKFTMTTMAGDSIKGFSKLELREKYYNEKGQLIKHIEILETDFTDIHYTKLDPASGNFLEKSWYRLHNNDTLNHRFDLKTGTIQKHVLKSKKNGVWSEDESSIMEYNKEGEMIAYKMYRNGELVQDVSYEELNKKRDEMPYGYHDKEEYGLPAPEAFTEVKSAEIKLPQYHLPAEKKQKYTVVKQLDIQNNNRVNRIQVFNAQQLILIEELIGSGSYLEFRYSYFN